MLRGRDSLLLEWKIGTCDLAMSVVCYLISKTNSLHYMGDLFGKYFTLGVWGVIWATVGIGLITACWYRYRPGIEWFSMLSSALWAVVTVKASNDLEHFAIIACLAPVICIYSGAVYLYHMRITHLVRKNGRYAVDSSRNAGLRA
jgi:hypothetical protein